MAELKVSIEQKKMTVDKKKEREHYSDGNKRWKCPLAKMLEKQF